MKLQDPTVSMGVYAMALFVLGVVLVVIDAARRVWRTMQGEKIPEEAFGPPLTEEGEVKMGCC